MGRWEAGRTALSRLASPSGPGETIQSVKRMLCKSDGLSQIPRTRVKMPDTVAELCKPQLGRWEAEMGGTLEAPRTVGLAYVAKFPPMRDPVLHKDKGCPTI